MRRDKRRAGRIRYGRVRDVLEYRVVIDPGDRKPTTLARPVSGVEQRVTLKPFDELLRLVERDRRLRDLTDIPRQRVELGIHIESLELVDLVAREAATDQLGPRLDVTLRDKRSLLHVRRVPLREVKHIRRVDRFGAKTAQRFGYF